MPQTPTRNSLKREVRARMVDLLNARLADAADLALQLKQAHWNVKGTTFYQLHELFDKLHDDVEEWVDDLAERAVQLGGTAEGTVQAVAKKSTLEAYPLNAKTPTAHLRALADSMAAFGGAIRVAIETAASAGDLGTSDLFTEISRAADKGLWFVEAQLS